MSNIVDTRIKAFGKSPKTNFVSPSEQLITLTIGQLQDLIKETIQPLQDEVEDLKATITGLNAKVSALETTQEQDLNRVCLDIAFDRQRLAKLERVEPQPLQKDRGDILRALIAANGGKILATDARKKMHLSRPRFSELLATAKDDIEIKPYHLNKSWQVLVLR